MEQIKGEPCALPNPSASCPSDKTAFDVARPRTLPVLSKTGPPELPGFIAAVSVNFFVELFTEEMIPVVRTLLRPKGEPSTPTHHPCFGGLPTHCRGGTKVFVAIPATSFVSFQETI